MAAYMLGRRAQQRLARADERRAETLAGLPCVAFASLRLNRVVELLV